ncbi:MAG: hypothetical protein M3Q89_06495 [Verrucomicrobiota bacterium]|nr:hypothetical protein [Verrucomicrobiota bacterium]
MKKGVRVIFWAGVAICGLLGVVHTAVTFFIFDHLTQRALYFAGTGLAAIVMALFNIAVWHEASASKLQRSLAHLANALMAGFAIVAVIAVPEPQAYVGAAAFWGLFLSSLLLDRGSKAAGSESRAV